MHRINRLLAALAVALLLSAPAAIADAPIQANHQLEFGLTDQRAEGDTLHPLPGTLVPDQLVMEAESPGSSGGVLVVGSVTWISEEPLPLAMQVSEQTVHVHLEFQPFVGTQTPTICVGTGGPGTGFTSHGCTTITVSTGGIHDVSVDVGSHTVGTRSEPRFAMDLDLGGSAGQGMVNLGPHAAVHYTELSDSGLNWA